MYKRLHSIKHFNLLFRRNYHILGKDWNPTRVQYTKYRITKPWTHDSKYDDILLSEPSKEDFYTMSKEMPVFLKFLNLITLVQKRPHVFREFAQRCEDGLVVEKDVYITKQELLDNMWENGFTEKEMNAFKFAFPDDYKFHYPELAVLFDLSEEDCYKYCIKTRASKPDELVELKFKQPSNLISSYGLVFLGCWFGLCNAVLGNAWFFAKTLPFGAVFYMLAYYYQRTIKEYFTKDQKVLIDKALEDKLSCEDAIYNQIKKYSEDASCNQHVIDFKESLQDQLKEFHTSMITLLKEMITKSVLDKLNSIALQKDAIVSTIKNEMVDELMVDFMNKFKGDKALQDRIINSAILEIQQDFSNEPVTATILNSLKDIQNNNSPIITKLQSNIAKRERELLRSCTIRNEEVETIAQFKRSCSKDGTVDVSKLSPDEFKKLQVLYDNIHTRLGIPLSRLYESIPGVVTGSNLEAKTEYENILRNVRNTQLNVFLSSF